MIIRANFLSVLFLLMLGGFSAGAQLFNRRAPKGAAPPKALLVTLLSRQNQREYLRKYRPDLLPEFEHDVTEVAKRTILDFSRYFKYCPVYFVIDSASDKVSRGEFDGVLLDSMLLPVNNPVLQPGDKNFFIAHYGSPIPQPDSMRGPSPGDLGASVEAYGDDPTALFREKLLVTDSRFRLLSHSGPHTNFVRVLRPSWMTNYEYQAYRRAITYNADRWFIDYMPVAYSYDATLRKYFR